MIELVRIGMVNWHLMPPVDIDVKGHIGVIGENRSGKSTLLDLIQTVLTGNSKRYLRLNASAGETGRKKSHRSVHAYCLGRLGPDETLRQDSRTYIYLGFRNRNRPDDIVTIGLALEARASESSEHVLAQFIAEGVLLSHSDLIETRSDGHNYAVDWSDARPKLEKACHFAGGALIVHRDQAKAFVEDYMRRLSTGKRSISADKFLKAFINAISFEQIADANEFVRRYILEQDDIRIGELRESIQTYRMLKSEISRARARLDRLSTLSHDIETFHDTSQRRDLSRWMAVRGAFDHAFRENRRLRRQYHGAKSELDEARVGQADLKETIAFHQKELEKVMVAIHSHTQSAQKSILESRKQNIRADLDKIQADIAALHGGMSRGLMLLNYRDVIPASFRKMLAVMDEMTAASGGDAPPAWPRAPEELARLMESKDLRVSALGEWAENMRTDTIKAQGIRENERAELLRQRDEIGDKGISLRRQTVDLLDELERMGYRPRVVCSLLRVLDESWRDAAEALLGRDREAIIVADEAVEEAIRFLQKNRRRFFGCRIVNTRKIDSRLHKADPGTLAAILECDDKTVMAFVLRRIGSVRLAETIADLHKPGRAIMRDLTYDDGLIVEMRDVVDGYKIGSGAGRHSLDHLDVRLAELNAGLKELDAQAKSLRIIMECARDLDGVLERAKTLTHDVSRQAELREMLDQITRDLNAIDRNIDPGLEARKAQLETQIRVLSDSLQEEVRREERAKTAIGTITSQLEGGDKKSGSRLNLAASWAHYRRIAANRTDKNIAHRSYHDALARHQDPAAVSDWAQDEYDRFYQQALTQEGMIYDSYFTYHSDFGTKPDFGRAESNIIKDILPWVERSIQRIEETELAKYEDQARDAAEKAQAIFQHSFINELRHRFQAMEKAVDDMNRILRPHQFHYESYRFIHRPVEAYRDIVTLVNACADNDAVLLPLFEGRIGEETPHADALCRVQDLLLNEECEIGDFEDYRQFFTFNLIMKDSRTGRETDLETRRGTGSGAEQQTPFYVAIGTALSAAYHRRALTEDGEEKGIGLAVFDEAFSKLDGRNQKACIDYYKHLGLQIVIAAPVDKRASFYETLDSLAETWRVGDFINIETSIIKDRTREEFSRANPANIDLNDFRALIANQETQAAE